MHYMLTPLDQHVDGGLGATGEAFEEAAKALQDQPESSVTSNVHLPISFLYRHSIELYLKSMLVVLHRGLSIPYGSEPHDGSPFIFRDGKWKSLFREHSIGSLWDAVKAMLIEQREVLAKLTSTDWQTVPDGLEDAIRQIEAVDNSSTFFRYPDERTPHLDYEKSSWKILPLEALHAPTSLRARKIAILKNDEGEIARAFEHEAEPMKELTALLRQTAETLGAAHTGLRVDLAGGF